MQSSAAGTRGPTIADRERLREDEAAPHASCRQVARTTLLARRRPYNEVSAVKELVREDDVRRVRARPDRSPSTSVGAGGVERGGGPVTGFVRGRLTKAPAILTRF